MSEIKKLLVVEDDKNLGFLLSKQLTKNGFDVDLAIDGLLGLEMLKQSTYDLCIIDVMMPKMDGLSMAKEIRSNYADIPFVFLTARNLKSDKITGYKLGCDDYITKPFDMDELIYKIHAILNRLNKSTNIEAKKELQVGLLKLHITERFITNDSVQNSLSHKETILLKCFFENANQVVSRKMLMMEAWGNDDYFTSKSLDVYLTKIRKVLGLDERIKLTNIHGFGYMLKIKQ